MAYIIPPDTRTTGSPAPAQDMDNTADMLGLITRVVAQLVTGSASADPAGNAANVTAVQGIVAAATVLASGGIFGTGSDGAAVLDGTATFPWASKAGSVYTMTRNAQLTSLTVNIGVTLKPANCLIFCAGTVSGAGTIDYSGANASGSSAGAGIGGSLSLTSNASGGAGGTGVSGAGASGTARNFGPASGAGGNGTSGAGGAAATPAQTAAALTGNVLVTPFPLLGNITNYANSTLATSWGAGGSGGGSDASSNAGGGGGAAGGTIAIFAYAITFTGTISANGGSGANGTAGNAGGGGGGTGGLIFTATLAAPSITTPAVHGGTKGTHAGTGADGSNGNDGSVVSLVV